MMKKLRSFGLLVICASALACKHDAADTPPPPVPPPPAAPADLLAYGTVGTPDATWTTLQKSLGPMASFLPATLAGLLGSAVGVDAEITSLADGASPAYLAIEKTTRGFSWAVAFRVRDAVRVRGMLLGGAPAKYAGPALTAPPTIQDVQMYQKVGASASAASVVIGVTAERFVFASDAPAMTALGAFAARTLPTYKYGDGAIALQADHASLAGPLHDALSTEWTNWSGELAAHAADEEKAHGRPADFGDPQAIEQGMNGVAQKGLAAIADLDHASLGLDVGVDDGAVVARFKATPTAGGAVALPAIAQLPACDAAPLKGAPVDTPIAFVACRGASSGGALAPLAAEAALSTMFGTRLTPADTTTLHTAFVDASAAYGSWSRLFVASDFTGVRLDTPATNAAAAMKATRELALLTQTTALQALLASALSLKTSSVTETAAHFDRVAPAKTANADKGAKGDKRDVPTKLPSIAALWKVDAGNLELGVGTTPDKLLGAVTAKVSDDASLNRSLGRLADSPSFALLVQPASAVALFSGGNAFPPSAAHSALVFGWGKTGNDAWMTLGIDGPLLHDASRMVLGL